MRNSYNSLENGSAVYGNSPSGTGNLIRLEPEEIKTPMCTYIIYFSWWIHVLPLSYIPNDRTLNAWPQQLGRQPLIQAVMLIWVYIDRVTKVVKDQMSV